MAAREAAFERARVAAALERERELARELERGREREPVLAGTPERDCTDARLDVSAAAPPPQTGSGDQSASAASALAATALELQDAPPAAAASERNVVVELENAARSPMAASESAAAAGLEGERGRELRALGNDRAGTAALLHMASRRSAPPRSAPPRAPSLARQPQTAVASTRAVTPSAAKRTVGFSSPSSAASPRVAPAPPGGRTAAATVVAGPAAQSPLGSRVNGFSHAARPLTPTAGASLKALLAPRADVFALLRRKGGLRTDYTVRWPVELSAGERAAVGAALGNALARRGAVFPLV